MTKLCQDLYHDYHHEGWNEFDLSTLPAKELQFLCLMGGLPYTGTKEKVVVRLLSCRICRLELSKFGDDPHEVAAAFKRDRLRWMCQQANLWKSGSKVQLAVVLLNWRNRCRHEGQKFYRECVEAGKGRAHQLELL